MSSSLAIRAADVGRAAMHRLGGAVGPIALTAVAAGLAWYLTHDVLGHRRPFFAPIAAVVCLSATNVLRGQRAVQMIIGAVVQTCVDDLQRVIELARDETSSAGLVG